MQRCRSPERPRTETRRRACSCSSNHSQSREQSEVRQAVQDEDSKVAEQKHRGGFAWRAQNIREPLTQHLEANKMAFSRARTMPIVRVADGHPELQPDPQLQATDMKATERQILPDNLHIIPCYLAQNEDKLRREVSDGLATYRMSMMKWPYEQSPELCTGETISTHQGKGNVDHNSFKEVAVGTLNSVVFDCVVSTLGKHQERPMDVVTVSGSVHEPAEDTCGEYHAHTHSAKTLKIATTVGNTTHTDPCTKHLRQQWQLGQIAHQFLAVRVRRDGVQPRPRSERKRKQCKRHASRQHHQRPSGFSPLWEAHGAPSVL